MTNKIQKNGFILFDGFDKKNINHLEVDFYNRLLLQAYKIRLIDKR